MKRADMKTTNTVYLIIVFAALTFVSCSDDFLEKKPLDSYSELDVFADAALLGDFVSGTYRAVSVTHSTTARIH
jgi:hypothetical protein